MCKNTQEAGYIFFSFLCGTATAFDIFSAVIFSHLCLDQLCHQNDVNRNNAAGQRHCCYLCERLGAIVYSVEL